MADPREIEFHCAAITGNMAVVDRFLEEQAAADDEDQNFITSQAFAGYTILHGACYIENVDLVRNLLSRAPIRNALLNAKDIREGRTPVHQAIAMGNQALFNVLIQAGADITVVDDYSRTVLHTACREGLSCSFVENIMDTIQMAKNGAPDSFSIHAPDRFERTPLHYAADNENVALVELLLSREERKRRTLPKTWYWNWCPEIGSIDNTSAATFESWLRRRVEIFELILPSILSSGVDIVMSPSKEYLSETSFSEREKELCNRYCNILAQLHEDPISRLYHAAARNDVEMLKTLIKTVAEDAPSDTNNSIDCGSWARTLSKACRYGNMEAAVCLIDLAPVKDTPLPFLEYQEEQEQSATRIPLQFALDFDHFDVVQEIIRRVLSA